MADPLPHEPVSLSCVDDIENYRGDWVGVSRREKALALEELLRGDTWTAVEFRLAHMQQLVIVKPRRKV